MEKHYEQLLKENRQEYIQDKTIRVEGEEVDENTIREAIKKLKNGKSCGPEGVYAELLKSDTNKLVRAITRMFKECINGQSPQGLEDGLHVFDP